MRETAQTTREPETDPTLPGRRAARYLHLRRRAERIAAGAPELTPEQYATLAAIFQAAATRAGEAT